MRRPAPTQGPGRINQGECDKCKMMPNDDDTDACMGVLPGVMNACCGHGKSSSAYVQFSPRVRLSGRTALACMWVLRQVGQ